MTKASVKPSVPVMDDDFEARHDADTLTRAEEIRSNPDRHEKARKHLTHRMTHVGKALKAGSKKRDGLKKTAKELNKRFR